MIAFISLFVQDSLTDIVWGGRAVCAASDLHDVDQVLGMWESWRFVGVRQAAWCWLAVSGEW